MLTCTYRLPHEVRDRLAAALKPFRNRDACLAFATFLGRFWTVPRRLGLPFMLDRRALAPVEALGLTEARIRGAIRTLERAGLIERVITAGETHQRTPEGLHRKPIAWRFAPSYAEAFARANKRAQAARERRSRDRTEHGSAAPQRPSAASSTASLKARPAKSPKYKPSEAERVHLGEFVKRPPAPPEPNTRLAAALERWGRALRERAG